MPTQDRMQPLGSIYEDALLEYRPAIGERVRFWTGRGSQGYAVVRALRRSRNLDSDLYLLDPEPDAIKGGDYWPRRGNRAYWGPRDYGVTLAQIEHEPRIWYQNF